MNRYLKYLFNKIKYLSFVLIGVILALIDYFLVYQTIEFTNLLFIILISSSVLTTLFLVADDLRNYKIMKKLLPLDFEQLKTLFKYLIYLVVIISFFGGRSLMIGNVIIISFLIFSIRQFYIPKFGVLIKSLFLFVINLTYLFVIFDEISFTKIIKNPYLVVYLVGLILIPLMIVIIDLIKKIKTSKTILIDYKFKNKERRLILTINGLYRYEDFANYLVSLDPKDISLDHDSIGVITYNDVDLLTFNVVSRKCFIYYLKNTNKMLNLIKDDSNKFNLTIYGSSVKRAEYLFKRYEGSFDLEHLHEYETYEIKSDLESKWLTDLTKNY